MTTTWIITGATSSIAEAFAHKVAELGDSVILVGRKEAPLKPIASNITLRYGVNADIQLMDFSEKNSSLNALLETSNNLSLFIAHCEQVTNTELNEKNIESAITTNITKTIQLIHAYLQKPQNNHNIIFVSSVAGLRGRKKNSFYGATKRAVDTYLEGLQHENIQGRTITIARLGLIDTKTTYGTVTFPLLASSQKTATSLLEAHKKGKRMVIIPRFWKIIMSIIVCLPFGIYKRLSI